MAAATSMRAARIPPGRSWLSAGVPAITWRISSGKEISDVLRRKLLQMPGALFAAPGDRRFLEELTETIIPADAHSPGAKAARVAEYIEQTLSASVDEDQRRLWKDGLAAIDRKAFLAAGPQGKTRIME